LELGEYKTFKGEFISSFFGAKIEEEEGGMAVINMSSSRTTSKYPVPAGVG